jgi:subtilisin family serine protease
VPNRYIVVLERDSKPLAHELARSFARAHNAKIIGVFDTVLGGFALEMPEAMAVRVSEDPRVESVTESGRLYKTGAGNQVMAPSWGLRRVDERMLPQMDTDYYYYYSGSGVTAYVLDTGVNEVGDLVGRVDQHVLCWNTLETDQTDPEYDPCVTSHFTPTTYDCSIDNHGTKVASTLGGWTHGVAKDVRIKDVQVFQSCAAPLDVAYLIRALQWVKDDHVARGTNALSVANISMDMQFGFPDLDNAIGEVLNAGVSVVIGAGNRNTDACATSPARTGNPAYFPSYGGRSAITVGASDQSDQPAQWPNWPPNIASNYGECVDLFAPGTDLDATNYQGNSVLQTFGEWWGGTSAAAPHVAGMVALELERNGYLPPITIENNILLHSTHGVLTNINPVTPNRLLYTPWGRRRPADH